jgi:hypothetical protein
MFIARQRLGKHSPAATNTQATIEELPFLCNREVNTSIITEELLANGVSVGTDPRLYNEDYRPARIRIEGVSGVGSRR